MGQQLAELGSRLPVPRELAAAPQQFRVLLDEGEPFVLDVRLGNDLPIQFLKLGLGVEQLELAGAARHEQENDTLRLGGEVTIPRGEGVGATIVRTGGVQQPILKQQRPEGGRSNPHSAVAEEMSSGLLSQNQLLPRIPDCRDRLT